MRRVQAAVAGVSILLGSFLSAAMADSRLYNQLGRGSMPSVPSIDDPAFQAEVLRAHNVERRLVGVRDLVWWPPLAKEAEAWAKSIAARNVMQHQNQTTHGESIWLNRAGMRTVGAMIGNWSIEKQWYIVGARHPNISTTGNWHHVGHYTQMVWASTTHVGCAIARDNGRDFLVCRYAPIGNFRGQVAFDPSGMKRAVAASPPVPTGPAGTAGPPAAVVVRASIPGPEVGTPSAVPERRPSPPAGTAAPPVAVAANPAPAPTALAAPVAAIPIVIPRVTSAESVPMPAAKPSVVTATRAAAPATARR